MIQDRIPSPTSLCENGYRRATLVVTVNGIKDAFNASSVPIYQTATFKGGEYDYSRSGNPTRTGLEEHLAKLMMANQAYAISSGMSALDVITRLVKTGQEVIAGTDVYGENNDVVVHHIDTTLLSSFDKVLNAKTRLVLLESPTNPLIKVVDIPRICELVHSNCPSALVIVDNTMMSPYLMNPLELGADIVYHSGTKYLSGHHDLMAGVIALRDEDLAKKIYFIINSTGCALAPFDSFLLLRGVKTLAVRLEKQQESALKIAEFLVNRGIKVRYPGHPSHPQYDLHASMSRGGGAVMSIETGDVLVSEKIVENTRLWSISVSFGCVNSLISMPCKMSHASIPLAVRKERELPEDLIRLCVGIEDVLDLIEDLESALSRAGL